MSAPAPLRWAILGTARIAEKIAAAIHAAGSRLSLVASRDGAKAYDWAQKHAVERSCEGYQAAIEDPDVDAVYIPLPPSLHHEWTIRAAEAGKHVLCEKPVAVTSADAVEMAAACLQHGVQFMDGVMWLHHPRSAAMHASIQSGELGEVRRVTSAFTFYRDFPLDEFRMQRAMGGGALLDLGWYCVGASIWAIGQQPYQVRAIGAYRSDVDISLSGWMHFPADCIASFDCAFNTSPRRWLEVAGTDGSLVCDDFTRPWNADRPRYWIHGAEGLNVERVESGPIQEVAMIQNFATSVQSGTVRKDWVERAIATQRITEALDISARKDRTVDIRW